MKIVAATIVLSSAACSPHGELSPQTCVDDERDNHTTADRADELTADELSPLTPRGHISSDQLLPAYSHEQSQSLLKHISPGSSPATHGVDVYRVEYNTRVPPGTDDPSVVFTEKFIETSSAQPSKLMDVVPNWGHVFTEDSAGPLNDPAPALLVHGRDDAIVHTPYTEALFRLRADGSNVTFRSMPGDRMAAATTFQADHA